MTTQYPAPQNELSCTFEELKRMSKEFVDAVPTLNLEELDNAWKCFSLGYLNMHEEMWKTSALILFKMMSRKYFEREFELLGESNDQS